MKTFTLMQITFEFSKCLLCDFVFSIFGHTVSKCSQQHKVTQNNFVEQFIDPSGVHAPAQQSGRYTRNYLSLFLSF